MIAHKWTNVKLCSTFNCNFLSATLAWRYCLILSLSRVRSLFLSLSLSLFIFCLLNAIWVTTGQVNGHCAAEVGSPSCSDAHVHSHSYAMISRPHGSTNSLRNNKTLWRLMTLSRQCEKSICNSWPWFLRGEGIFLC